MGAIRLATVVGARPQFIKAAAVSRAIGALNAAGGPVRIDERIIHTGQHYDDNMSAVFFEQLAIPAAAVNLGVGSGGHGRQTGLMLQRLEEVLLADRPDWVLVYGDTNSTLAGALAAAKMHIPVAHVEAGLRSFNRRMPEEINRLVADQLAALRLCPTRTAVVNLTREGFCDGVHLVGDVMHDSIRFHAAAAQERSDVLHRLKLTPKSYFLATVHRAENTDDPKRMNAILSTLGGLGRAVVMPVHPRTAGRLPRRRGGALHTIEPLGYIDMMMLEKNARIILTDSGGVQKEAYWLGVPCVTLREETEWVELVEAGCNRLAGADPGAIERAVEHFEATDGALPVGRADDLYGDGHSAERILQLLTDLPIGRLTD